jgi:hypothetical protein
MAQFKRLSTGNIYNTIQDNGSSLPQEQILNFIGTQFTIADDPGNSRTNITFPDFLELAGGTMLGNLILNADPSTNLQAATKQYVDSMSAGLSVKTSCVVATTAALTATYANGASGVGATLTNATTQAALSIDGVSLSVNDRVLVKDQASQLQNGIYKVTTVGSGATNWVLTRTTDYDTSAEVVAGTYTIIELGTVNATNMFVMTQTGTITMGTTAIVFSAFNSAANISVTAPITKSGNVIALTTPLAATYGGTGVSNSNTITLGGNISTAAAFTTSGANALTLTTTGSTNVTLPTTGTLVNTAVTTLSSLASIGTITTGVWNGTLIGSTYGGTGVNNGSSTITLGGNLTTSGAFASIFTMTNTTNVTFPTSGTLATTSQIPSTPISLANGGTGASLAASNGGIFYSNATTGAILSGTATANQVLLSGTSAAPAWSTATYPATTTVSQILYSSSTNVIGGITTGNNGVLITSAGGVPSISSTIPTATQDNITRLGTVVSGVWNGTAVDETHGGTNQTSYTQGDILYASASNTLSKLAKNTTAARYLSNSGTSNNPAWAQVDLTTGVTGALPTANGGTGVTVFDPVIQRVSTITGAVATGTTNNTVDDNIPTNTNGDQYMSLAITPKNTNNILVIEAIVHGAANGGGIMTSMLFQDSVSNALSTAYTSLAGNNLPAQTYLLYIMTAGTTSSTTFKIRACNNQGGNTFTFNGFSAARKYGGTLCSGITITEYAS